MATSRVGRKPVVVPIGIEVKIQGQELVIKGPKGQSKLQISPLVCIELNDGKITFSNNTSKDLYSRSGSEQKLRRSIVGTMRATINNLLHGMSKGYERKLVLVGVGYRAQVKGKVLHLAIGYSHPVTFTAPEGITIEAPSQTEIIVKGSDKHLVGQMSAKIRAIRGPEPYKGKGIRYANEVIILKETKKK